MHPHKILEPYHLVKLFHYLIIPFFSPDIISGCENMACINTYTHSLFVIYVFYDMCEMLKPVANIGTLTRSSFKYHRNISGCRKCGIDIFRNYVETFGLINKFQVASGMHVQCIQAELITSG